jgi:hypothetical protein
MGGRAAKNGGDVTKNAVTSGNPARKVFGISSKISTSEIKANLHRGWVGVPFLGSDRRDAMTHEPGCFLKAQEMA